MRVLTLPLAILLLWTGPLCAAPQFPELTGRVVDNAGMLDPQIERRLTAQLKAQQEATTNQVVVVTLKDLQGYTIEEFGYQLGRHWGIGQEDNDNGVLLIVAQDEREVRIEVGYGLEGQLTDALASRIIHGVIVPAFKKGDFSGGIVQGTRTILAVLGGNPDAVPKASPDQDRDEEMTPLFGFIFFLVIMVTLTFRSIFAGRNHRGGSWPVGTNYGGSFDGGGGFSGGGGSFGGGGASGGW